VICTLFLKNEGSERHVIFMIGVAASEKVGNLWFRRKHYLFGIPPLEPQNDYIR